MIISFKLHQYAALIPSFPIGNEATAAAAAFHFSECIPKWVRPFLPSPGATNVVRLNVFKIIMLPISHKCKDKLTTIPWSRTTRLLNVSELNTEVKKGMNTPVPTTTTTAAALKKGSTQHPT